MADRAAALIAHFGLEPHPEGGWYRRRFRSDTPVAGPRGLRAAVTTIVFLLRAGEMSRWHRVHADEIWHFYEGAPLRLLTADPLLQQIEERVLQLGTAPDPVAVVPASHWQAAECVAESTADYTLVGCTVAPGFDFVDFALLAEQSETAAANAQALRTRHPGVARLL